MNPLPTHIFANYAYVMRKREPYVCGNVYNINSKQKPCNVGKICVAKMNLPQFPFDKNPQLSDRISQ